jgi:hypothetical protein
MNSVRRTWSLDELQAARRKAESVEGFLLRCKHDSEGLGKFVKEGAGVRQYAEVAVTASPAPELSVSFAHDWLAAVGAARAKEFDEAVLQGIVEALASRCELPMWGCAVRTEFAACAEGTSAPAVRAAAALAIEDLIRNADWTPEPPAGADAA